MNRRNWTSKGVLKLFEWATDPGVEVKFYGAVPRKARSSAS